MKTGTGKNIGFPEHCVMSIPSEKVLTAAHCCDGSDASSVTVRAGTARHASGGTVYDVAEVKMHPNYDR